MASTITFCTDDPIRTTLDDWLFNHIGRVSVGREQEGLFEILAYSDQKSDFPELKKMSRRENAVYIKSIISEGVTTLD